ncbi:unnamed protein product, partial [Hapterophycus canaliculatus]
AGSDCGAGLFVGCGSCEDCRPVVQRGLLIRCSFDFTFIFGFVLSRGALEGKCCWRPESDAVGEESSGDREIESPPVDLARHIEVRVKMWTRWEFSVELSVETWRRSLSFVKRNVELFALRLGSPWVFRFSCRRPTFCSLLDGGSAKSKIFVNA